MQVSSSSELGKTISLDVHAPKESTYTPNERQLTGRLRQGSRSFAGADCSVGAMAAILHADSDVYQPTKFQRCS